MEQDLNEALKVLKEAKETWYKIALERGNELVEIRRRVAGLEERLDAELSRADRRGRENDNLRTRIYKLEAAAKDLEHPDAHRFRRRIRLLEEFITSACEAGVLAGGLKLPPDLEHLFPGDRGSSSR